MSDELVNPTAEDAPIIALLSTSPDEMTTEQLTDHVARMRALRTSPQTRKSATSNKTPKKSKTQLNLDALLD